MFHSAAVKLTIWYLGIIMAISLVFSASLYQVSRDDLYRNVNRQISYFSNLLGPDESANYRRLRTRQLNEDLRHLKGKLVLFNIVVLAGGGAASYWLARRTLEPIEQALESQTRFASDASHELRTPLTAMITENEVALRNRRLGKAEAVEIIESNLEEAVKLKMLAEGLLRLTKSNGKIDDPKPTDVGVAAAEAVERYALQAKSKKLKITNKIGNLKVMGERSSLVELFSIFIDNAIKYSAEGGQIGLTARRRHNNVAVKISDTGQGIKAADLPRIFERFYRTDSSRQKTSGGGYGLGLSIAKKIVDAHLGHIEVASTPGRGTVFTVFLPAA